MGKRVQRRRVSPLRRVAKILYGLLVALSAVVVVLYVFLIVLRKEPTMAPTPTPPPVGSAVPDSGGSVVANGLVRKDKTDKVRLTCPDATRGNADSILVAM